MQLIKFEIMRQRTLPQLFSVVTEVLLWLLFQKRSSSELLSSSLNFFDFLILFDLLNRLLSLGKMYFGIPWKNHAPDFFQISRVSAHIRQSHWSLELLKQKKVCSINDVNLLCYKKYSPRFSLETLIIHYFHE